MILILEKKTVYGIDHFYPINDTAKIFANLLGQKTLTIDQLKTIKLLNYEIEIKQDKIAI